MDRALELILVCSLHYFGILRSDSSILSTIGPFSHKITKNESQVILDDESEET